MWETAKIFHTIELDIKKTEKKTKIFPREKNGTEEKMKVNHHIMYFGSQ
jgi:hypothetical protein